MRYEGTGGEGSGEEEKRGVEKGEGGKTHSGCSSFCTKYCFLGAHGFTSIVVFCGNYEEERIKTDIEDCDLMNFLTQCGYAWHAQPSLTHPTKPIVFRWCTVVSVALS